MNLVIEHSKTRRTIEGQFHLCTSRADMEEIVRQLTSRLSDKAWAYGWMTIYPGQRVGCGGTTKAWDE